jgi:hypothetical protein
MVWSRVVEGPWPRCRVAISTRPRLCRPMAGCSTTYHHVLAYRDGSHLSVAGSYIFQDDLRATLASLLESWIDPAHIGSVRNR